MSQTILNRTMIICPSCRRDLLIADINRLASYVDNDVIMAEDFKSAVDGWKDPSSGDVTHCPYCGSDYGQAIRKAWMNIRSCFIIKEWDE